MKTTYKHDGLSASLHGVSLTVPLTIKQWNKLNSLDYIDVVLPCIENAGGSDVEYNGHFGRSFFFHCEQENVQKVLEALATLLRTKTNKSKEYFDKELKTSMGLTRMLTKAICDTALSDANRQNADQLHEFNILLIEAIRILQPDYKIDDIKEKAIEQSEFF